MNTKDMNKSLKNFPPSEVLLQTKILRSKLVAAYIWGDVHCANYTNPDPSHFGWVVGRSAEQLMPDLANKGEQLDTLVKAFTVTCSCSSKLLKNKCSRCKCGMNSVACLDFCKCMRVCQA